MVEIVRCQDVGPAGDFHGRQRRSAKGNPEAEEAAGDTETKISG